VARGRDRSGRDPSRRKLAAADSAARLALADPDAMSPLLHWPLSLLVTFLVPIIIADHVVVFWRIATRRSS